MKKKLVVEPCGGLGNRITVLHSAIELARDIQAKEIEIIWVNNDECGCDFYELFDRIEYPYVVKSRKEIQPKYKELLRKRDFLLFTQKAIYQLGACVRHKWLKLYKRDAYIRTYRDFYGKFSCEGVIFNKTIEDEALKQMEDYPNYVAMHIRRTDNQMSIKLSPDSLFQNVIEELIEKDDEVKIYIATDDASLWKKLKALYPNQIIDRTVNLSRANENGMRDALLEMIICGNAKKLYGSEWSSFSKIAHLYGNNEYEVVVKAE